MEALRKTNAQLEEKIKQIELRLAEQKKLGRAALKLKNRPKVAQHARAVKALEGQMSQLSAMKANLFERQLAEEMATLTKSYTDAIAGALKHNKKGTFDIDQAMTTIDSSQEQMEQLNEFSEAVRDATEAAIPRAEEDDIESLFREDEVFYDMEEAEPIRERDVGPPVATHPVVVERKTPRPPPTETNLDRKLAGISL